MSVLFDPLPTLILAHTHTHTHTHAHTHTHQDASSSHLSYPTASSFPSCLKESVWCQMQAAMCTTRAFPGTGSLCLPRPCPPPPLPRPSSRPWGVCGNHNVSGVIYTRPNAGTTTSSAERPVGGVLEQTAGQAGGALPPSGGPGVPPQTLRTHQRGQHASGLGLRGRQPQQQYCVSVYRIGTI